MCHPNYRNHKELWKHLILKWGQAKIIFPSVFCSILNAYILYKQFIAKSLIAGYFVQVCTYVPAYECLHFLHIFPLL